MAPRSHAFADSHIICDFDDLIGMAKGEVSPDELFMNGQLKVEGNLSKGHELRWLLGTAARDL